MIFLHVGRQAWNASKYVLSARNLHMVELVLRVCAEAEKYMNIFDASVQMFSNVMNYVHALRTHIKHIKGTSKKFS